MAGAYQVQIEVGDVPSQAFAPALVHLCWHFIQHDRAKRVRTEPIVTRRYGCQHWREHNESPLAAGQTGPGTPALFRTTGSRYFVVHLDPFPDIDRGLNSLLHRISLSPSKKRMESFTQSPLLVGGAISSRYFAGQFENVTRCRRKVVAQGHADLDPDTRGRRRRT